MFCYSRLVKKWLCSGSGVCTLKCSSKNEATKLMAVTNRTLNTLVYYLWELKVLLLSPGCWLLSAVVVVFVVVVLVVAIVVY